MSHFLNLDFVLLHRSDFVIMLSLHKAYALSEINTLKTRTQVHIDSLTDEFNKADVYRSKIITLKNRVFDRNKIRVDTLTDSVINSKNPILASYQDIIIKIAKQLALPQLASGDYQVGLTALKNLILYAANDTYSDIVQLQLTIANIEAEVVKLDKLTRLKELDLANVAERKSKVQKFMRYIDAAIELSSRAVEIGTTLAEILTNDVDTIMARVRETG